MRIQLSQCGVKEAISFFHLASRECNRCFNSWQSCWLWKPSVKIPLILSLKTSTSGVNDAVEWNSWLNGRREKAPTPEVLLFLSLEYLVPQCFSPAFTFPTISKCVWRCILALFYLVVFCARIATEIIVSCLSMWVYPSLCVQLPGAIWGWLSCSLHINPLSHSSISLADSNLKPRSPIILATTIRKVAAQVLKVPAIFCRFEWVCEWGKSSWICPYQVLTWQATHEWSRKWLSWKPIVKLSRWRLPVCFLDLCAQGLVHQCLNGNRYCNFVFMAYVS